MNKKNITAHPQAAASINTGFAAFLRLEGERKFEVFEIKCCKNLQQRKRSRTFVSYQYGSTL